MDIYIAGVTRLDDNSINYSVVKTYKQVNPSGYNYDESDSRNFELGHVPKSLHIEIEEEEN